jgi:hypothetical protein
MRVRLAHRSAGPHRALGTDRNQLFVLKAPCPSSPRNLVLPAMVSTFPDRRATGGDAAPMSERREVRRRVGLGQARYAVPGARTRGTPPRLFAGFARDDVARECALAPLTTARFLRRPPAAGPLHSALLACAGRPSPTSAPMRRGDEPTQLVCCARSHSVRDVVMDGRIVVRDRAVTVQTSTNLRAEAEGPARRPPPPGRDQPTATMASRSPVARPVQVPGV